MKSPVDLTIIISGSISHVRSATGLSVSSTAIFTVQQGPVADRKSGTDQMAIVTIPFSTTLPASPG